MCIGAGRRCDVTSKIPAFNEPRERAPSLEEQIGAELKPSHTGWGSFSLFPGLNSTLGLRRRGC